MFCVLFCFVYTLKLCISTFLEPLLNKTMLKVICIKCPFISERAKRASSVMFVFNRDFRYVRIYIYLTSHMLGQHKWRASWPS